MMVWRAGGRQFKSLRICSFPKTHWQLLRFGLACSGPLLQWNIVDWDLYIFLEKSSNVVSSPQRSRTGLGPKSKLFLLKRLGIVNLTFEGKSLEYYCPLHQSKTNRCDQFVTILYQNRYKYIKIDTTIYKQKILCQSYLQAKIQVSSGRQKWPNLVPWVRIPPSPP